jgi:toxin-antitoxin system PIN domain toxin
VTSLLDANVLIALVVADHVHHDAAEAWFLAGRGPFATCPITEGSLVRLLLRDGESVRTASAILTGLAAHERHRFWTDDLPYTDVDLAAVVGHRQVTDAYLAQLARAQGGRLATFDRGLAKAHPDVSELVPTN